MRSTKKILQIVGNETRRDILTLLSDEPHYISQIAKKLDVTQPAILKHLNLLQKAGLIENFWRKSPFGADRKYFKICDSIDIEIAINPNHFKVSRRPKRRKCTRYLETEQEIKRLTQEINTVQDIGTKAAKAQELMEMADSLLSCTDYKPGNWNCENCHRTASLSKETCQIILWISEGDIESGLRQLTKTINQLVSDLLSGSGG